MHQIIMVGAMIRLHASLFLTMAALLIPSSLTYAINPLACCPVGPPNSHVINTDQSVIILWDKEQQTQHFIRRADFKTDAKDIGFIVPSPSRPRLEESGDAAFATLARLTAPTAPRGIGIPLGCSAAPRAANDGVMVIEQKRVAGYDATVLTATSGDDLVAWLGSNGYPYSPSVAEWAKPYLGGDWHFTALKLVKDEKERMEAQLKASSLRISFKADTPLFPYREPDSAAASKALASNFRLLRIYFIAETQYEGKINGTQAWSGSTRWSGNITKHRGQLLQELNLAAATGPETWWLTEIEDQWPYEKAAGDVYLVPVAKPMLIDRDGRNQPYRVDASLLAMLALGLLLKLRKWGI